MKKITENIIVEIDGERFDIGSNENQTPTSMEEGDVTIVDIDNGIYEVNKDKVAHKIILVDFDLNTRTCTVEIDGQTKHIRILNELDMMIEKMGLTSTRSNKQSLIEAPMPGLVSAIKVSNGDHVEKGTPLLILEAMKMENVIAAPHSAVIKEIKVKVGQAVERGLPLIEFSSIQ